jgi:hypothetical protein
MHLRRRSPQATSFSASGNSVYLHAHSNSVAGHASAKRGGLDFRVIVVIDHLRELIVWAPTLLRGTRGCVSWLFARDEPVRGPRQHSGWAVNDNRVGPILDRKLDVGFADGNPVHLAAMGALNLQCLLPGSGEAVWVGLDTGRGSTMGSGACEEQRRHNTLPVNVRP